MTTNLNKNLFCKIIHYFLQKKPNLYIAKLHKLLYFLEFNYLERNEEELLKEDFLRNHKGPTSNNLKNFLDKMINDKIIASKKDERGWFNYYSIEDIEYKFNNKVQKELDLILDKYINLSTKDIADLSHQDKPYKITPNQSIIDKCSVFYRNKHTSIL